MSKDCKHKDWQERTAMTQKERFSDALNPGSLELMDFSLEKWMEFAFNFAEKVSYFDESSSASPNGNWEKFFIQKEEIKNFIKNLDKGETTPHLALFACFLHLLELPRSSFNKLTKRHLDYYYQEVLQIKRKPAEEDQVYLVFELAKNISDALLEPSNLFDAGKDESGKRRFYALKDEFVCNDALVSEIKNVSHHKMNSSGELTCAPFANSLDGQGEPLDDDQTWYAFGYPADDSGQLSLPRPRLGFVLSSEVLRMSEGKRTVTITINYDLPPDLVAPTIQEIFNNSRVKFSGEKDWVNATLINTPPNTISSINSSTLVLVAQISAEEDAIVNIGEELHNLAIDTSKPAVSVEVITDQDQGLKVYDFFSQIKVSNILIGVHVEGVSSLKLDNDQGVINPKKPFYPFGTSPMKRSNFDIEYPEVFAKNWSSINLDVKWKNTPDNFVQHYFAYRTEHLDKPLNSGVMQMIALNLYDDGNALQNFGNSNHAEAIAAVNAAFLTGNALPNNLIVKDSNHFTANQFVKNLGEYSNNGVNIHLFQQSSGIFSQTFQFTNSETYQPRNSSKLRVSLNQSFYHSIYPKIYVLAMSSDPPSDIPNEPYTPMMEQPVLSYTASARFLNPIHPNDAVNFYHLHPFGVSNKFDSNQFIQSDKRSSLMSRYEHAELYVGLEKAIPKQQISLLFQLFEGSENPLAEGYGLGEGIEWSILIDNKWQRLQKSEIIKNEIDNFLKSGIFSFTLPSKANLTNTLMPKGKYWLRATHFKSFDAVCKIRGIHAQAAPAQFVNQDNSLEHLIDGLPAETISKLAVRIAEIKKVIQPYSSFGGRLAESDEHYYIRVSERLRHKNRAINQWDYEHLILEAFPHIHQVKCLNHTSLNSFNAPGHVTILVIPNTVDQNVFDIYQPRVSQAVLNEIARFVNSRNTLHVDANVINPNYEIITVDLQVKFNTGLDYEFYKKKLEHDILKLLSPWAFNETESVKFGVKLYRSQVINYIEKLNYVDFIADFKMRKRNAGDTGEGSLVLDAIPSNPKSILVSDKIHIINEINSSCVQLSNQISSEPC